MDCAVEPPRRLTLGYSLKNIPIPPTTEYMKVLIEKTNSVIRRMRWRAHHYLRKGKEDDEEDSDYYGFKSRRSPPHIEELKNFEDDLASMIGNVRATLRTNFLSTYLFPINTITVHV